jgi:hypothetical protein
MQRSDWIATTAILVSVCIATFGWFLSTRPDPQMATQIAALEAQSRAQQQSIEFQSEQITLQQEQLTAQDTALEGQSAQLAVLGALEESQSYLAALQQHQNFERLNEKFDDIRVIADKSERLDQLTALRERTAPQRSTTHGATLALFAAFDQHIEETRAAIRADEAAAQLAADEAERLRLEQEQERLLAEQRAREERERQQRIADANRELLNERHCLNDSCTSWILR